MHYRQNKTMMATYATYATLATSVMAVHQLVFLSLILNFTPPENLAIFPYYDMVQFHLHACPFIITSFNRYFYNNRHFR